MLAGMTDRYSKWHDCLKRKGLLNFYLLLIFSSGEVGLKSLVVSRESLVPASGGFKNRFVSIIQEIGSGNM